MPEIDLITQLKWCIAGIERDAQDTIWVEDPEYPNRPETVVECLHGIIDVLQAKESSETAGNSAMVPCKYHDAGSVCHRPINCGDIPCLLPAQHQ